MALLREIIVLNTLKPKFKNESAGIGLGIEKN
jgi:hypothetical protein